MADRRWRLVPGCTFARKVPDAPGSGEGTVLACLPNYAKAKWSAGVMQPVKFYLRALVVG